MLSAEMIAGEKRSLVGYIAVCFTMQHQTPLAALLPSQPRARAFAWDEVGRVTWLVGDAHRRLRAALPVREHIIYDDKEGHEGRCGRSVYRARRAG